MLKSFLGIAFLLLLLTAGSQQPAQARATPWDCSAWQPYAHADRATAILESLAENRGKTLYCGLDQSDTFGKAETWAAGKDRNERDDTVYFGERGQFRGFIAAQEGWLTDGESGITGQSQDRIFEFPREKRRVKRVKRFTVGSGSVSSKADNTCMTDLQEGRQPGSLLCSNWNAWSASWGTSAVRQREARNRAVGIGESDSWLTTTWNDNLRFSRSSVNGITDYRTSVGTATPDTAWWQAQAETAADNACRARGARPVANSAAFGRGHSEDAGGTRTDQYYVGEGLGIFFDEDDTGQGGTYKFRARQSRAWSATCKKVIRRTR